MSISSEDDGLMNEQMVFKGQIERANANFKKTPKDRLTKDYVEIKLDLLNNMWTSFSKNHQKIANTYDKSTLDEHVYSKEDVYFKCEEEYTVAKCAMMKKLREFVVQVQPAPQNIQTETPITDNGSVKVCEIKIPTIKIPTFNGSYTEWCSFHDQFSSLIHNNEKLSSVQKLHYLKTNLSGEAATLLKNVTITDENYNHAWSKLLKRYQNKRIIVNAYLSKLFSIKNITTESAYSIKNMLDTTSDCLNGLRSLKISTDSWDSIIIFMTVSKLDAESLKQWEEKLGCHDELPSLEQLTDFLEGRFRSLEGMQAVKNRTTSGTKSNNSNNTKKVFHTSNERCVHCNGDHYLYKCKDFADLKHNDRLEIVTKNGLCFNCLIPKHRVTECRQRTSCKICRKKHHSLLHPEEDSKENTNETHQTPPETPRHNQVSAHFAKKTQSTGMLLATAIIGVQGPDGSIQLLRALIDQGSEGSFITESAAQALGLRRYTVNSSVSGLGANTFTRIRHKVTLNIQSTINNKQFKVDAFCLSTLTRLLPSRRVHVTWPHIQGLPLADSSYATPGKIDILLGAKIYSQILLEGVIKGPPGSPLAQNTQLGWILSGEVTNYNEEHLNNDYENKQRTYYENITDQYSEKNTEQEKYTTRENDDTTDTHNQYNRVLNLHIVDHEETDLLQKFWELESETTTTKIMTDEEQQCERDFKDNYTRDDLGRYIVKIPMKTDNFDYGDTKQIALQRLNQLEKKLNKDPALKEEYSKVIQEYLDLNHMEKINKEKDTAINTFYLPHHAVIRHDKSTSKVRIVFNASSKGPNGKSLNDNMLVGPTIQQDLRQIVMRWRTHEIGYIADCVKFYRQVKVTEECADYQRILWRMNGELNEYKLTRVTFGTASAPYLATKALHQLAIDEEINFPIASTTTKLDYYIDDFLSGSDNLEESCEVYRQMTGLMKAGGFQLQKWASNNRDFEDYVQKTCCNSSNVYKLKSNDIVKTLGLIWNKETDEFQYTINLPDQTNSNITKRTILSDISRLFDPMGWLSPVIIVAKIMIQQLWLAGVTWDQNVPTNIKEEWELYRQQLTTLQDVKVNRWIHTNRNDHQAELHGYCDASQKAYAAVIYLRVLKSDGSIHINQITAKTRVAPIKTISIPRLELCAAVLLTKLLKDVSENLNIPQTNIHAYTDSTVVLAWLQSHPSKWKTFIANRTSDILTTLPRTHWHHVSSAANPADVASRGIPALDLLTHKLWWNGPEDLKQKEIEYKQLTDSATDLEERKIQAMTINTVEDFDLLNRYSSLTKLLRVTAYILRACSKEKHEKHLTGKEITSALTKCINLCQKQEFNKEIERLLEKKPVKNDSRLKTLNPFIDPQGILRVGGRLANAEIPDVTKHQVILPGHHPFTKLVLTDIHKQTMHGGPMLMLSHLRTTYWITNAKTRLRQIVHKCVTCARHRASTGSQMMGSLPPVRVTPTRAFQHSGVDFAGPIDLRLSKGRGCKTQKGYLSIFVCMVTRAIHIEIVTSLTAIDFVSAFKRFVARRGRCSDIWSDNATNFIAGNKELNNQFGTTIRQVRSDIENLLANDRTTWHHIPASGPHFGGLWEASVKLIKFHLKRVLGNTTLTYEEMSTVTAQIEACVNSRPISHISDDPSDITPLTPGHFLIGEAPITVPEETYLQTNTNRLSRWQLTQRRLQDFWSRWSKEYLTNLQQRPKWLKALPNLQIGDLVIVKEDHLPPSKWVMARIIDTHPGGIT